MMCSIITLAGVVAGVIAGRATAGKAARDVVKTAVKGGLVAGRAIQNVAGGAREKLSDIAAGAKAELSKENEKIQVKTTPARTMTVEEAEAQLAAVKAEMARRGQPVTMP